MPRRKVYEAVLRLRAEGEGRPDAVRSAGPACRRYATGGAALLPHHADLLRQRRAPRGHGLHDGERRRPGPLAPPAGRRRLLHDRYGRARGEDRRSGRGPRHLAPGVDRPHLGPLRRGLEAAQHQQRRLHPHHRAPALRGGAAVPPAGLRQRLHRARAVHRALLRVVRGLLHRGPARGRQVPGPRPPGGRDAGGQLLLPAERVRAAAARVLREPSRLRPPDLEAQRGARLHPGRPQRRLHHPYVVPLGRAGPVGRRARLLRLVRRADQLPHGGRPTAATRSGSPRCGGRRTI